MDLRSDVWDHGGGGDTAPIAAICVVDFSSFGEISSSQATRTRVGQCHPLGPSIRARPGYEHVFVL